MTRIQIRLNNSDPDLQHFILMIEWCREEMLCPQPVPLPDIPHDSQVTFEVSLPWTRAVDPHSFSADPDLVFFSQWRIQMRIRIELYKTAVSVKTFTLGRVCFDWHLHQCRHWVSAHIINWFFFKFIKLHLLTMFMHVSHLELYRHSECGSGSRRETFMQIHGGTYYTLPREIKIKEHVDCGNNRS